MAVVPSLLYRGTLTNTNATLKTTDAIATTVVTSIVATNRSSTAGWFTVTVNGFYLAYQMPVAGNQTVTIDVKQVTGLNVAIQGLANAGSTIDLSISGVVSTGPADMPWTSYTPTLTASTTNPTNWTQTGYYMQMGKLVVAKFRLNATGTMTAGSGVYRIAFPINALYSSVDYCVGSVDIWDSSPSTVQVGTAIMRSSTYCTIDYSGATNNNVTNALPWVWASGDNITGTIIYEAA